MGWTKRQFVTQAFEEIGLASYVFDLTPEQLQSALRRLDTMMAAWNALGIRLGYPLPSSPQDSDLDEQTNVPDSSLEAIYTNLAIKLAPSYGKQVMPDTKATAKESYNTLLSLAAMPMEQQMPGTMPAGAGKKPWRIDNPFGTRPQQIVTAGANDALEIPDVMDTIGLVIASQPLGMRPIIQQTTIVVQSNMTWTDYSTRWDFPPVEVGTSNSPAVGAVYSYTLEGVTRYRLVPTVYAATEDAFYTAYADAICTGLIVRRSAE